MADEKEAPINTPTPTVPEVAPAAPAAEPVVVPAEVAPTVAPEAQVAEVKPAEAEKTPEIKTESTALGSEPVKEEIKSEEVKSDTQNESKQSDEPAPLPTYEAFKLPEGFSLEEGKLVEFTKDLAEFEVKNKADHAEVQALGQRLIERYTSELKRLDEQNIAAWEKIKSGWKEAFHNDPEIGGNRRETTIKTVTQAVESYAGTNDNVKEFRTFVNETGVGEHPAFIRLVSNMDRVIKDKDEVIKALKTKYESEDGVKPLAGTKPDAEKPQKIYQKMYGTASNNL